MIPLFDYLLNEGSKILLFIAHSKFQNKKNYLTLANINNNLGVNQKIKHQLSHKLRFTYLYLKSIIFN
jgi:hypothetical protein